ncbi:MAG: DNA-binding protein [Porticoccaceae bacterium]
MTTINIESVSAAADALLEQGQKPTLANVRSALGGGSFSTISPLLKEWKESQRTEEAVAPLIDPAPEEITSQVQSMASHIWQAAMNLANARLQQEREALDATRTALEAERDEAAELADLLNADLEKVTNERDLMQQALDTVRDELAESQQQAITLGQKIAEQSQSIKDAQMALQAAQARGDELRGLLDDERAARTKAEEKLAVLHEKAESNAGTISMLKAKLEDQMATATDLQARLKAETATIADLQAKLKTETATTAGLQAKLVKRDEDLANAKSRADYVQARLDEAERIITKVESEKEQARNDAKFAGEVAAELKGRIGELEKRLAAANQSKT